MYILKLNPDPIPDRLGNFSERTCYEELARTADY